MGCDIHAHLELKVDGQWHHYGDPYMGRDYDLFERMAGVRGDLKDAIAPPRGLPKDITLPTREERAHDGLDGHSDSWLSLEELHELSGWIKERQKELGRDYRSLEDRLGTYILSLGYPDKRRPYIQDARLVFWFDN